MSQPSQKLLYIAGAGRMGSTLMGKILGQADGFFFGGEMHTLWRNGIVGEVPCSCHAPIKECEVWRRILIEAFGSLDAARAELRPAHVRQYGPTRLPAMMIGPLRRRFVRSQGKYLDALARLYHAIFTVTGARVVVDSSQKALYGALLETIPSVELFVVYLLRDPRAYAHSWMKPRQSGDRQEEVRVPGWSQSLGVIGSFWCLNSLAVERILERRHVNSMRVRYEDFLARPEHTLREVLAFVGELAARLPLVDSSTVQLETSHACYGNHSRFRTGAVPLRLDDAWKTDMSPWRRRLVTLMTWPMMLRYGYSLRASSGTKNPI